MLPIKTKNMKNPVLIALFSLFCASAFSQADTIYIKNKQKIACKIIEINPEDIKYKRAELPDGPIYVVEKTTIWKYCLSNGVCETILPDELSLENEHAEILNLRTVYKIHPFSMVNRHISFAYEKVLRVGTNLDIEVGYVNSNIQQSTLNGISRAFHSGGYLKPGMKFFLGQDFNVKGLKYAHPLKGRYIKLDFALAYLNFQDLQKSVYTYSTRTTHFVTSDMNIFAYGGFVNYGRQFILGNFLTLEYYVGAGFTGATYKYTNPEYAKLPQSVFYSTSSNMEGAYVSNFYGFLRIPTGASGLSFTGGFRVGYIVPEKKIKHKPLPTN